MSAKLAISRPKEGAAGKTGTWRTYKPVVDRELCHECGLCRMYCPDGVIDVELNIDLEYCKGCGICAKECPKNAITMEREE